MNALAKIVKYLDSELNISAFKDDSNNGLQVQNSGKVQRVCIGVDASMPFFEAAAEKNADLLICHHGMSWGDSLKRISGLNYRRLKFLLDRDIALYACHLPLDAHPRLGNNALICKAFGLRGLKPFGSYHGSTISFRGTLPKAMPYSAFKAKAAAIFGNAGLTMDYGKKTVKTVAVISGGAARMIAEAGDAGIDVFLSGEPNLSAWNLAREYEINAIFAGHYATETFGVKAVANVLKSKFKLKTEFIDTGARV